MAIFPSYALAASLRRVASYVACYVLIASLAGVVGRAQAPAPAAAPDTLVLSNGDTLHGKFVNEVGGKVTFHSDPLGDVSVGWDKIKELHTTQKFAVLDKNVKLRGKMSAGTVPVGTIDVANQSLVVHLDSGQQVAPIETKNAQYVIDAPTLNKQAFHNPGFFTGWNGAATAGATLVTATQDQYTFSGGIGLVRMVPTVAWLNPRDRTSMDFTASYGKITQPGSTTLKSSIYHADAERDQFFSPRLFALGQVAFDHNFSQDLDLQQIYGGGFGFTALKSPKQEADVKGTVQYEKQQFIQSTGSSNQNLVGSTFSLAYVLHEKLVTYTQGIAYIPAWNQTRAYSATETNTLAFPAYKSLSFSVGTLDSYLNDPPLSVPPTKRNSFQFTMGLTYAIKSRY
jgi:hypothetical protein